MLEASADWTTTRHSVNSSAFCNCLLNSHTDASVCSNQKQCLLRLFVVLTAFLTPTWNHDRGLAQNRHRGLTTQLAYSICSTIDHLCQTFAGKGSCLFHQPQYLQTCTHIRGATGNLCFSCHGSEQDELLADTYLLAHVLLQSLADASVYT